MLFLVILAVAGVVTADDWQCTVSLAANGEFGQCAHVDTCPYGYFVSNKCPSYGNDVKCCYNCHLGGCSTSSGGDTGGGSSGGSGSGGYGNIMEVDTTGASGDTASQDNIWYSGVAASHQLASNDLSRLNTYKAKIIEAGQAKNMDAAVIAAIISRESRAGAALASDGTGDGGNGFGLMQVDYRYHTPVGGPYSLQHIKQGTDILIETINCVRGRHPDWSTEMVLKGGLSGYNAGCGNVQTYAGMDIGTTGDDYGNDVSARAQWLKGHGF